MAGAPPRSPGLANPFDSMFDEEAVPNDADVNEPEKESYDEFARKSGLSTTRELESGRGTIEGLLRQAGVDVENPQVQLLIQSYGDMLRDPSLGGLIIADLAATYPAVPSQPYDDALALSGFSGDFVGPQPSPGAAQLAAHEGFAIAEMKKTGPAYEENPDTGWIRYKNGVLVSPDGQVAFDPTSKAPGSVAWQRDVVSGWGEEQVDHWANRLVEYGYLSKDQAKKASATDPGFLSALSSYHTNRYVYGKPVSGELAGVSGTSELPPLVDFEEQKAQTRNFIREQYRRVFGEEPSDGEVIAFSEHLIDQAMKLQRKYRRKPEKGLGAQDAAIEAEERLVERFETSPEATFMRETDEENTRLRDALQNAVVVTNSLGG